MKEKCERCDSKYNLIEVTVYDKNYTLCRTCEQELIFLIINGGN